MGYRGQVDKQNRARDLRAQGWTLTEICEELGCSRSSASAWCRDADVDEEVLEARRRQRFLDGNHGARLRGPNKLQRRKQAEIEEMRLEGIRRVGSLSEREHLIAGLAYYSGEGAKTDGEVRFANSDPRLVAFFLAWFRRFFDIDEGRLRLRLYLHEGLDLEAANEFWSQLTAIPLSQFGAPYRAVADPSIRKAKHPLGCPSVNYSSARTHRAIMGMIDALLTCETRAVGRMSGDPSRRETDPG